MPNSPPPPPAPVPPDRLPHRFFDADVETVARALIGATLLVDGIGGRIVETEAYDADDPASHSVRGPTPRNAAMFGPAGHAYVYRSYGIHWCLNVVCRPRQRGADPRARTDRGDRRDGGRRGLADPRLLCAGPGRLCQALGIDGGHDGADLGAPPFALLAAADAAPLHAGPRIGITRAVATPWRFCERGSRFLSRPAR